VERPSGAAPPLQSGRSDDLDSAEKRLRVEIEPLGASGSVVSLEGELDLSTVSVLEKRLRAETAAPGDVIVDLTRVSFIDSSGIGLLIGASRSGGDETRLLTVVAEGSQVDRVFKLARIDSALPLFADRERAIEALSRAPSG
jgi:anti-sigma B factor antagonist